MVFRQDPLEANCTKSDYVPGSEPPSLLLEHLA